MGVETTKKVNETIIGLCNRVQKILESGSVEELESLPSLVTALATLVRS